MRASHQTCPHCHTPIAVDRFELASDGTNTYRVCPECDYTWCVPGAPDLPAFQTVFDEGWTGKPVTAEDIEEPVLHQAF